MKLLNTGILFLALLLTACADRDPLEKIVNGNSGEMFSLITSKKGRAGTLVVDGVKYYATFNDEEKKATVTISNLRLADDDEPLAFTFSGLDWKFGNSNHTLQRVIEIDRLVPDDDFGTGYVFEDFVMIYSHGNEFDSHNSSGFFVSYKVNGVSVMAYPHRMLCQGTTMVREAGGDNSDVSYDTNYEVNIITSGVGEAVVDITGLNIGTHSVDLSVSGLKLELADGGYDLSVGTSGVDVESSLAGVGITQFEGHADLLTRLVITMDLTFENQNYAVTATLTPNLSDN